MYDPDAIVIKSRYGDRIGYIPQLDNVFLAQYMDLGTMFIGVITHKEWKKKWLWIEIDIFC